MSPCYWAESPCMHRDSTRDTLSAQKMVAITNAANASNWPRKGQTNLHQDLIIQSIISCWLGYQDVPAGRAGTGANWVR